MDLGDLKSKEIGALMSKALLNVEKEMQANGGKIPDTIRNQNLGHNAKKESLGPNTKA